MILVVMYSCSISLFPQPLKVLACTILMELWLLLLYSWGVVLQALEAVGFGACMKDAKRENKATLNWGIRLCPCLCSGLELTPKNHH